MRKPTTMTRIYKVDYAILLAVASSEGRTMAEVISEVVATLYRPSSPARPSANPVAGKEVGP